MRRGFTLIELLVALSVVAVLGALSLGSIHKTLDGAKAAACVHSLRQLGMATTLYLAENNQRFFYYRRGRPDGTLWYFGLESGSWLDGEGTRNLDATKGPLYPYLRTVGGVEICPGFDYGSALWKPKFKGASWGYGYNVLLGGGVLGRDLPQNLLRVAAPSRVIVFGDCAQVNTFQPPASAAHPMIEEFYVIDQSARTIHFRHNGRANFLFADGHVEALEMAPGTLDTRLPEARIGRITPVGSMEYLQ